MIEHDVESKMCARALHSLHVVVWCASLSDQCRFKPAKTAAANPMPELGTSVVRGHQCILKAIFVLKNAQLPTTCTYLDDHSPHLKTPTMANLAETCQKKQAFSKESWTFPPSTFRCHAASFKGEKDLNHLHAPWTSHLFPPPSGRRLTTARTKKGPSPTRSLGAQLQQSMHPWPEIYPDFSPIPKLGSSFFPHQKLWLAFFRRNFIMRSWEPIWWILLLWYSSVEHMTPSSDKCVKSMTNHGGNVEKMTTVGHNKK